MCGNCENLFCSDCINDIQDNIKKCPCCRDILNGSKINRLTFNILENMELKCPFLCDEIILYSKLKIHFKKCVKRIVFYSCKFCFYEIESSLNDFYLLIKHSYECREKSKNLEESTNSLECNLKNKNELKIYEKNELSIGVRKFDEISKIKNDMYTSLRCLDEKFDLFKKK